MRSIFTGILLLVFVSVHAQIAFRAQASTSGVRIGDVIQVTYSVQNGSASRFVPPDFSPFDVVYGPAKSQSFSVVNGKVTRSLSFTYGIRATRQGKFNIPGAAAEINGVSRKTNSIVITVTPAGLPGSDPQEFSQDVSRDELFILVSTDKKEAWQGEQVIVTYRLYYRVSFDNIQIIKTPSYNNFLMHDFKVGQPPEDITTFNGQRYYTQLFKKVALFPTQAGTLKIDPIELECTVLEEIPDPTFHDPFFSRTRERKMILRANDVSINVRPLPETGKPADFSGAVGHFSLEASLDRYEVAAGEGATLKAALHGAGNLKIAQINKPQAQEGMDIYDPTITDNFTADRDALRGDRSFDFVVVPAEPGNYTIQPVSFSYFDPNTGQYTTPKSGSFSLKVTPATVNESNTVSRSSGWKNTLVDGLKVAAYAVGLALLVLSVLALVFYFWYRSRKRRRKIPVRTESNASKTTVKQREIDSGDILKEMRMAVDQGDISTFYKRMPETIWQAAQEKGMTEPGVYNKGNLLSYLRSKDIELANAAEQLLEHAEMYLYGGLTGISAESDLLQLENLLSVITTL